MEPINNCIPSTLSCSISFPLFHFALFWTGKETKRAKYVQTFMWVLESSRLRKISAFEFFYNTTNKKFNEVFLNSFQQGIILIFQSYAKPKMPRAHLQVLFDLPTLFITFWAAFFENISCRKDIVVGLHIFNVQSKQLELTFNGRFV